MPGGAVPCHRTNNFPLCHPSSPPPGKQRENSQFTHSWKERPLLLQGFQSTFPWDGLAFAYSINFYAGLLGSIYWGLFSGREGAGWAIQMLQRCRPSRETGTAPDPGKQSISCRNLPNLERWQSPDHAGAQELNHNLLYQRSGHGWCCSVQQVSPGDAARRHFN